MARIFFLLFFFSVVPLHSPIAAEHPGVTHNLLFKGKVTGTDEQVIVWDTAYAPNAVNPRHLHPAAVTFRVLSGTGIWQEDGKPPVTLHAGDTLLARAGIIHTHWNPSATETLRFLEFIARRTARTGRCHSPERPYLPGATRVPGTMNMPPISFARSSSLAIKWARSARTAAPVALSFHSQSPSCRLDGLAPPAVAASSA
jgi:quercetin dioxygenase-like cupin family protein